jgi:VanZ family protein
MKNSSFYFYWKNFLIAFVLGLVGFLATVFFSKSDRRDKIYSGLLGWFLGTGLAVLAIRFGLVKFPF